MYEVEVLDESFLDNPRKRVSINSDAIDVLTMDILEIARKANINVLKIVIFQTLAANLGSSFTPMGNPQNLFIYSFYNLSPIDFFKITLPIIVLAVLFG